MEAAELFDRFYQEQIDKDTADGSIWEYKDDIEKLMVDYYDSQISPISEHIERIINDNTDIDFFKREVELSFNSLLASEIPNMKTSVLIEFINAEFPNLKESVFYSTLILKLKLLKK